MARGWNGQRERASFSHRNPYTLLYARWLAEKYTPIVVAFVSSSECLRRAVCIPSSSTLSRSYKYPALLIIVALCRSLHTPAAAVPNEDPE